MEDSVSLIQPENSTAMDTSSETVKSESENNLHNEVKMENKENENKQEELNKNALIAVLQFLKKHNLQVYLL